MTRHFLRSDIRRIFQIRLFALAVGLAAPVAWAQAPLEQVKQIAAGDAFSCALTTAGAVKCWGGALVLDPGLGAAPETAGPGAAAIEGLESGVTAIAAGNSHTCALMNTGGVRCWGSNSHGQLTRNAALAPPYSVKVVDAAGATADIVAIGAGPQKSCAVTQDGKVKCWGANPLPFGQPYLYTEATEVAGLQRPAKAVAVGGPFACALLDDGSVQCWGDTAWTARYQINAVAITAGEVHACALTADRKVQCWGRTNPSDSSIFVPPTEVTGLPADVAALAAGAKHSCALTAGGAVSCWGSNAAGQLADGTRSHHAQPMPATAFPAGATGITAGRSHTCALFSNGRVQCAGSNLSSQLGNGLAPYRLRPVAAVAPQVEFTAVAASGGYTPNSGNGGHTCALSRAGGVWC